MPIRNFSVTCLICFFCCSLINSVWAQNNWLASETIFLNWSEEPRSFNIAGEEKSYLHFEGAAYHESQMLPLWIKQVNLPVFCRVHVELDGAQYEPLAKVANLAENNISSEAIFDISVSYSRKRPVANINMLPIRKNPVTGQYERLISATLRISTSPDPEGVLANSPALRATTTSKLSAGAIYKIAVTESGVHKIDYALMQSLGVDVNNIDPRNIQLLGNSGVMLPETTNSPRWDDLAENAIFIQGESDGRFDSQDYILFYASGPKYWVYNSTEDMYYRVQNIYSNETYYFIRLNNAPGKRITNRASMSGATYTTNAFDAFAHSEKDEINLMEKEFALPPSGRLWVGNPFQISRQQTFTHNFTNRIVSEPVRMRASLVARAFSASNFEILANGNSLMTQGMGAVSGYIYSIYASTANPMLSFTSNSPNISIELRFSNASSSAEAWLNFITLNARCNLAFTGSQMAFRDRLSIGQAVASYQLSGANNLTIWDVTRPSEVVQQLYNGQGNIDFAAPGDTLREFVAFNGTSFLTPTAKGLVANQNLHGITSVPELLIVYHRDFQAAAMRLANHRANHNDIDVLAVDVEQIYNEFSSGAPDVSAIRDFAKMLYDRSSGGDSLCYLLLMGAGSFDYKGLNPNRTSNPNFILTYQTDESLDPLKTYTSDDYFALLDDGEGNVNANQNLDIAIGRLPVRTAMEADQVVDKIIRYDTDPEQLGDWKNRITFIADDEDNNLHINDAEGIAAAVAIADSIYNQDKIYIDAFTQVSTSGGSRYPDANEAILRNIFKGSLVINYLGHGGGDGWAQERIFTTSEINALNNKYKLPLFITATCSFAPFDDPAYTSAGELLILNPEGGASALLTTVRVVLADANEHLTRKTFENIFRPVSGRMPTVGEILLNAKNSSGILSASNSRKYILLGDPSMQLGYPKYKVATTTINGQPITGNDTIMALQQVTVTGKIMDEQGNFLPSFNGIIYPTVFDKTDTISTKINDAGSRLKRFPLQKKVIFKGRASVVNGEFSFSFIVPVDINYQMGKGKISYYAEDGQSLDANGSYRGLVIGGTYLSSNSDEKGPDVKVYMNDEDFASGGVTNSNPELFVRLFDESGINTVGNGIGHDLTGLLTFIQDDKESNYNLNDFYESDIDDFKSGSVRFPLSKLSNGKHYMKVKAWDVYNNMGEGETEFVVANSSQMALQHVLNYPNPFTTHTEFQFEHNLPGLDLDVLIQIYTVSGRLIKTIQQNIGSAQNSGFRVRGIAWDGLDDFGDRIGRGVYIYKVSIRVPNATTDGAAVSFRQMSEYQKLVILR